MKSKRETQRQAARKAVQALLAAGLSAPELGKMVTEVAAGQKELTLSEFKLRYPGAFFTNDRRGNKVFRWAGRVGGKYGRAYVSIGTVQEESIATYTKITDEVKKFKAGATTAIPTLDSIIAGQPQNAAGRTISQQLDRDMAARAADPSKTKSRDNRSFLREMLGDETTQTLTRELVRTYCTASVWRGNKDKTITDALFHLRAVVARMIPDEDTAVRNVVADMVNERKARLQPIATIWAEARSTLTLALAAKDKQDNGKSLSTEEDKALKHFVVVGKNYNPHTMRQKGLITPTAWASIEQKLINHIIKPISRRTPIYRHLSTLNYLRAKHARRRHDVRKAREVVLFLRVIKGQFQRFTAVRALRWTPTASGKGNFIDFNAGELVLYNTKNTHAGWCEVEHQVINPEISEALQQHRRRYPTGDEVFAALPLNMSQALNDYRDRAGIIEMDNIKWYCAKHTGMTTARRAGATQIDFQAAAKVKAVTAEQYYRIEEKNAAKRAHANYHPISEIKAAHKGRLLSFVNTRETTQTNRADKRLTSRRNTHKPQSEVRQ